MLKRSIAWRGLLGCVSSTDRGTRVKAPVQSAWLQAQIQWGLFPPHTEEHKSRPAIDKYRDFSIYSVNNRPLRPVLQFLSVPTYKGLIFLPKIIGIANSVPKKSHVFVNIVLNGRLPLTSLIFSWGLLWPLRHYGKSANWSLYLSIAVQALSTVCFTSGADPVGSVSHHTVEFARVQEASRS